MWQEIINLIHKARKEYSELLKEQRVTRRLAFALHHPPGFGDIWAIDEARRLDYMGNSIDFLRYSVELYPVPSELDSDVTEQLLVVEYEDGSTNPVDAARDAVVAEFEVKQGD